MVCEAKSLHPLNHSNDTLLHLATTNTSAIAGNNILEPEQSELFPSDIVVKFLLDTGFDPNSVNDKGETPLHVAAKKVGSSNNKIHFPGQLTSKI